MSTVVENIENPSTRQQFVHACSRLLRLERDAIAVVSTAMISALLVTAVAAQQTQPKPQQAPTTATVPASPELAPRLPAGSKPSSLALHASSAIRRRPRARQASLISASVSIDKVTC